MKRFILVLAVPAALAFAGCSSEEPQRAIHVSGSASMTPPSSEPKVIGSETKAGARNTADVVDVDTGRRTTTETTTTEVRTNPDARREVDVRRGDGTADIKPVKPVDTSRAGQPDVKRVDADLSPSGKVNVNAPANGTGYFEVNKDGKTYVFSSLAAMQKFNNGDTNANFATKTGPNGEKYWVEADHADSLSAEYAKAHPAR